MNYEIFHHVTSRDIAMYVERDISYVLYGFFFFFIRTSNISSDNWNKSQFIRDMWIWKGLAVLNEKKIFCFHKRMIFFLFFSFFLFFFIQEINSKHLSKINIAPWDDSSKAKYEQHCVAKYIFRFRMQRNYNVYIFFLLFEQLYLHWGYVAWNT